MFDPLRQTILSGRPVAVFTKGGLEPIVREAAVVSGRSRDLRVLVADETYGVAVPVRPDSCIPEIDSEPGKPGPSRQYWGVDRVSSAGLAAEATIVVILVPGANAQISFIVPAQDTPGTARSVCLGRNARPAATLDM